MGPTCRTRPTQPFARTTHAHAVDSAPMTHAKAMPAPPQPFLAPAPHSLFPSSLSSSHRVCCFSELRLVTSDLGHPSVRSLPLYLPRSTLTDPFSALQQLCHRRTEASPRPYRRAKVSELSLKVTNLPLPLISPSLPVGMHNRSPELSCATTEPPRHGPPPSGASVPVLCPRSSPPCHPEPT
jgi:hypothetical protein